MAHTWIVIGQPECEGMEEARFTDAHAPKEMRSYLNWSGEAEGYALTVGDYELTIFCDDYPEDYERNVNAEKWLGMEGVFGPVAVGREKNLEIVDFTESDMKAVIELAK